MCSSFQCNIIWQEDPWKCERVSVFVCLCVCVCVCVCVRERKRERERESERGREQEIIVFPAVVWGLSILSLSLSLSPSHNEILDKAFFFLSSFALPLSQSRIVLHFILFLLQLVKPLEWSVCTPSFFPLLFSTPSPFCILCHFQSFSFFSLHKGVARGSNSLSPLPPPTTSFILKPESFSLILQFFTTH